jgi:hypothetical protein
VGRYKQKIQLKLGTEGVEIPQQLRQWEGFFAGAQHIWDGFSDWSEASHGQGSLAAPPKLCPENVISIINEYPQERGVDLGISKYIINDLNANALYLVFLLLKYGVIDCSEEDYNKLAETYNSLCALQVFPFLSADTMQFVERSQYLIDQFEELLMSDAVTVNADRAKNVVLLGDNDADRGASDYLIYLVLKKLGPDNLKHMVFIASNHGEWANAAWFELCKAFGIAYKDLVTDESARHTFCERLKILATYQDEPSYLSLNLLIRQLRTILNKVGAGSGFIFDRPAMQIYPRFGNSFLFMILQLAGLATDSAAKALHDIVNVRLQICRQSYVTYSHAGNVYSHAITPLEDFFKIAQELYIHADATDYIAEVPALNEVFKDDSMPVVFGAQATLVEEFINHCYRWYTYNATSFSSVFEGDAFIFAVNERAKVENLIRLAREPVRRRRIFGHQIPPPGVELPKNLLLTDSEIAEGSIRLTVCPWRPNNYQSDTEKDIAHYRETGELEWMTRSREFFISRQDQVSSIADTASEPESETCTIS